MAMTKCEECGKEISESAESCPHCGHKPSRPSGCFIVIVGLLAFFAFGALVQSCNPKPKTPPTPKTPSEIEAETEDAAISICRYAITKVLHDPDSAEFVGKSTDSYTAKQPDGTWLVERKLRAKNAFGAYQLATYECHLKQNPDKTWDALGLRQLPP